MSSQGSLIDESGNPVIPISSTMEDDEFTLATGRLKYKIKSKRRSKQINSKMIKRKEGVNISNQLKDLDKFKNFNKTGHIYNSRGTKIISSGKKNIHLKKKKLL